jgi:hypothetical protein
MSGSISLSLSQQLDSGMSVQDAIGAESVPILPQAAKPPVGPLRGPSPRVLEATGQHGYALHHGNAQTPMVRVVPDARWPGMWRMLWPDGRLSDMTNLARAKDAASTLCERESPGKDRRRFHWKASRGPNPIVTSQSQTRVPAAAMRTTMCNRPCSPRSLKNFDRPENV